MDGIHGTKSSEDSQILKFSWQKTLSAFSLKKKQLQENPKPQNIPKPQSNNTTTTHFWGAKILLSASKTFDVFFRQIRPDLTFDLHPRGHDTLLVVFLDGCRGGGSWGSASWNSHWLQGWVFCCCCLFLRGRLETVPQKSFLLRRVLKQQVCKPVIVGGWGLKWSQMFNSYGTCLFFFSGFQEIYQTSNRDTESVLPSGQTAW